MGWSTFKRVIKSGFCTFPPPPPPPHPGPPPPYPPPPHPPPPPPPRPLPSCAYFIDGMCISADPSCERINHFRRYVFRNYTITVINLAASQPITSTMDSLFYVPLYVKHSNSIDGHVHRIAKTHNRMSLQDLRCPRFWVQLLLSH